MDDDSERPTPAAREAEERTMRAGQFGPPDQRPRSGPRHERDLNAEWIREEHRHQRAVNSWAVTSHADAQLRRERNVAHKAKQLAADAELVRRFRACGCAGSEWERWCRLLINSTTGVLIRACQRGLVFRYSRNLGWPRSGSFREWTHDELKSFVGEVQAVRLHRLRKDDILGGKWDPRKGSCLRDYYLNGCYRSFVTVWDDWVRENKAWPGVELHADIQALGEEVLDDDTGDEIDHAVLLDTISRKLTPEQFAAWQDRYEGLSHAEIAERRGITPNASASLYKRAQAALREQMRDQEGGDR